MEPTLSLFSTALIVICAAVGALYIVRDKLRSKQPATRSPDERSVDLSAFESSPVVSMFPSISTVTIFEGDALAAEAHLRSRVAAIVEANPWLEGRLVRSPIDKGVRLLYAPSRLSVDATTSVGPRSFAVAYDATVCDSANYMALTARLTPWLVARGSECIDATSPVPLFRVTLIRDPASLSAKQRFAVCMSLCHVFADGHTFYNLHSMLSADTEVAPLIIERLATYERDCSAVLGGDDSFAWMSSPGAILRVLWTLAFSRLPDVLIHTVSSEWIVAQKMAGAAAADSRGGGPSFVSTNDVLTSWLWAAAGTDVGLMAVNLRGRIPALTQAHAGNYEALVAYQVRGRGAVAVVVGVVVCGEAT